jgi:hypothetical protein
MRTVDKEYFTDRTQSYLKSLAPLFSSAEKILSGQVPTELIPDLITETKGSFPVLLAELPYLGGDQNLFNASIIAGVAGLAYIQSLEKHKLPPEIIQKSLYEIYSQAYSSLPGIIKKILMWNEFSSKHMGQLKEFAIFTQKREFPENYVVKFVPGYGSDFNYGFDCLECAVMKYYLRMGAKEYLPYICVGDFAQSRAIKTGLTRSQTLLMGGECCDFRYKRNTLGLIGYPIEKLPEYKVNTK